MMYIEIFKGFVRIEGQLFWDYLKKIDEKTDVSDDDSANNNIVNENKQITKTLTEMLEHGKLVPDVSNFTAPLCALIYNLPIHFSEAIHVPIL